MGDHGGVHEAEAEVGVLDLQRRCPLGLALVSSVEPVSTVHDLVDEGLPTRTAPYFRSQ